MRSIIRLVLILSICCLTISPLITTFASKPIIQPIPKNILHSKPIRSFGIISSTLENHIQLDVTFPKPQTEEIFCYHSVRMLGLPRYGDPGEPILPLVTVKAVIPPGKKVNCPKSSRVNQ